MRERGVAPAAIELFDNVGAAHANEFFTVEESWRA